MEEDQQHAILFLKIENIYTTYCQNWRNSKMNNFSEKTAQK